MDKEHTDGFRGGGMRWGEILKVALTVDDGKPFIYIVVEPGYKKVLYFTLTCHARNGMGWMIFYISDDPKELTIKGERFERIFGRGEVPVKLYIYALKLDNTTVYPVYNWLLKVAKTDSLTVVVGMIEPAIKPEIVDIVDNSFKGGLRKPIKEIIKSLEEGFGELLKDFHEMQESEIFLAKVIPPPKLDRDAQ
jgi:hypothetical protein